MEIKYYPAIIYRSGEGYGVVFPDLDGCISYGATEHLAALNANEAIHAHLALMVKQKILIPPPSHLADIADDPDGEAVARILVRAEIPARWVRVNISMEETLLGRIDRVAKELGMSRSGFLAEAARRMAG